MGKLRQLRARFGTWRLVLGAVLAVNAVAGAVEGGMPAVRFWLLTMIAVGVAISALVLLEKRIRAR